VRSARTLRPFAALAAATAVAAASVAAAPRATLVFCAPGSPGTTEEAQGAMDAFAAALARRAGLPPSVLAATYASTEDAGVGRLRADDAAVALVSLPFFLKHEKALSLRAELSPVPQGAAEVEQWSLVARKGRVASAAALDGFTVVSSAGYAPAFVRGPALGGFGKLPAGVKIEASSAVLSALRRAAAGEPVAVLLDGAQSAAVASLPFASDLEVVARSPALPAGVVARVDRRMSDAQWKKIAPALRALPDDPAGAEALAGIRMARFGPLDAKALAGGRAAYAEASR
jgi:ABC-type phosphate/phosphonate transport system substrate-binding protein